MRSNHPNSKDDKTPLTRAEQKRLDLVEDAIGGSKQKEDAKKAPSLSLAKPQTAAISTTSTNNSQTVITTKHNKKVRYHHIAKYTTKKMTAASKCQTRLDKVAKGFALSMVHQGVNNCLAQSSIISMYQLGYRGIHDSCIEQKRVFQSLAPSSKSAIATIAPPAECSLDKNNIHKYEKAILDAHKADPKSVYGKFQNSPYWGASHDGINKFNTEYNGVFLQGMANM